MALRRSRVRIPPGPPLYPPVNDGQYAGVDTAQIPVRKRVMRI